MSYPIVLSGWSYGLNKIELTKLIRASTGKDLAEAKRCVDNLLDGKDVPLVFADSESAEHFCEAAERLGARIRAAQANEPASR